MVVIVHSLSQIQSIVDGSELMDEGPGGLPSNPEELAAIIEEVEGKIAESQAQIAREEAKMEQYRVSKY